MEKIKSFSKFNEGIEFRNFSEKSHHLVRHMGELKRYIESGANVDEEGGSLLRQSVLYTLETGDQTPTKYLIESGADVTIRSFILYKWISQHGNVDLLKYFFTLTDLNHDTLSDIIYWCETSDKIDDSSKKEMISLINKKISEL